MPDLPVLLVVARFYGDIAAMLEEGARRVLEAAKVEARALDVPGAFEIPGAIACANRRAPGATARIRFRGYVALGCVIRGETSHYDHVCAESARGLMDLTVRRHLAIGYGILTCENRGQALERADPARGDRGADAARACLAMASLERRLAEAAR